MNLAGMALTVYGSLMLVFTGFGAGTSLLYAALALIGAGGLMVSFYMQCSMLKIVDSRKLPMIFAFWGAVIVCLFMTVLNCREAVISGTMEPAARAGIGIVMIAAAVLIFQKKVAPVNLKAARLDTVLARPTEYLNREKRRYTLMVTSIERGEDTRLSGMARGEICSGDDAVLLTPGGEKRKIRIRGILVSGSPVSSVKDQAAVLIVSGLPEGDLIYGVVSSIMPTGEGPASTVENPLLRGMSCEYAGFSHDHAFMTCFVRVLVHSRFMVPVLIDRRTLGRTMNGDTQIGFMAVNRRENGKETKTFALFSDENALHGWSQLYRGSSRPTTLAITFQDAVSIMWKGHQGIVINPFGPVFVYLPAELIDVITRQDAYQREFGGPGAKGMSFEARDRKNDGQDR